jgi:hypothetical protein
MPLVITYSIRGILMKKFGMCTGLFCAMILVTWAVAVAEPTDPSEIGLYTNEDGTGATGTFVTGEPVSVYLVLTRPTDTINGGVPCTTYNGMELRMTFAPLPAGDLILMDTIFPGEYLDIGVKDFDAGILDFIVGVSYGLPLPVVNESIAVAELVFMNLGFDRTDVFLGPIMPRQSIDGEMAFLGGQAPSIEYTLLPMYSMGGSHDAAAFEFNGAAVAIENAAFGSVKALYR